MRAVRVQCRGAFIHYGGLEFVPPFPDATMAFSQITTGDVDLLDRGIMKSERQGLTSDLALLKRLKAGQESAYRELLAAYGGRLLSVARRYMRNEEDSQDVLQDAFVQAFRKIHQFRGEASLGSWLHRIVVNSALMAILQESGE